MAVSEFHDEYSESIDADVHKLEGALLSDTVKLLAPSEPIRCAAETTVHEAISQMVEKRRAAPPGRDGEWASCWLASLGSRSKL